MRTRAAARPNWCSPAPRSRTRTRASGASLARAADQLTGTERFLKAQNDAVRRQVSAEADAVRAQNRQMRERIDHLLLANDQYRRTLAGRGPGSAEGR